MSNIRAATVEDADFLAWVIQAAARSHVEIGVWDLIFPGEDAQRLDHLARLLRTEQAHYLHWSRFLVAEVEGQPAAALSAYENAAHGQSRFVEVMLAEIFPQLGWKPEKFGEIVQAIAPYSALGYPNPDGLWVVEWVATGVAYRGRGLVRELLEAILQQGRDEGFTRTQIGYLLGNHAAKSAYEGAGFVQVDEYRAPEFEAVFGPPGIVRLQRDL